MKTILCAAAGTAMLFAAGAAEAATVWATDVDWSNNGTVPGSNDRDNPLNALGAPDDAFMALGLTSADGSNPGFSVFSFGGMTFGAGASATAYEVTFNCALKADGSCSYPESMEVLYGTDYAFGSHDFADLADFTSAGEIFNGDAQMGATLIIPGTFTYIALVDTTLANFPGSPSFDGFDIDAVGVNPVPVPGAALLFVPAVLGGALARRKVKRA